MWLRGHFKQSQIGGLDLWEPVSHKLRPKRQHCSLLYVLPLKSYFLTSIRSPISFTSVCPQIQAWQIAQFEENKQKWHKRTEYHQYCYFLCLSFRTTIPFLLSYSFHFHFSIPNLFHSRNTFSTSVVFSDHFNCLICRIPSSCPICSSYCSNKDSYKLSYDSPLSDQNWTSIQLISLRINICKEIESSNEVWIVQVLWFLRLLSISFLCLKSFLHF
jgi:hypothetical protein